jgi:hypothetical protein
MYTYTTQDGFRLFSMHECLCRVRPNGALAARRRERNLVHDYEYRLHLLFYSSKISLEILVGTWLHQEPHQPTTGCLPLPTFTRARLGLALCAIVL